jgi:hypothetical protein
LETNRVREALDVVSWLGERLRQLPEEKAAAVQMQLTLAITGLYLAEYVFHQDQGRDAYDSLLGTVRGEVDVPDTEKLWAGLLPPAG